MVHTARYESTISYPRLFPPESRVLLSIPLSGLIALCAGAYIGYQEGKGVDPGVTLEYATKYGPTALSVVTTPFFVWAGTTSKKWLHRKTYRSLHDGSLEIKFRDGSTKRYGELGHAEKGRIESRVHHELSKLEQSIENPRYRRRMLSQGAKAAAATAIGYWIGRAYSAFS